MSRRSGTLGDLRTGAASDLELAQAAAAGDDTAFETLVTRHRTFLHVVCRRITCHDEDARDALQEALLQAWRGIARFEGRSSPRTWLYRIAVNASLEQLRRRGRRPPPVGDLVDQRVSTTPSPEHAVTDAMAVDWALARMPPQFRAAVVLRELCDLGYEEIADVRGLPINTVKTQISRGRQALRDLLGNEARS